MAPSRVGGTVELDYGRGCEMATDSARSKKCFDGGAELIKAPFGGSLKRCSGKVGPVLMRRALEKLADGSDKLRICSIMREPTIRKSPVCANVSDKKMQPVCAKTPPGNQPCNRDKGWHPVRQFVPNGLVKTCDQECKRHRKRNQENSCIDCANDVSRCAPGHPEDLCHHRAQPSATRASRNPPEKQGVQKRR